MIAVVGLGKMGQAVTFGLTKLGHRLLLVDINKQNIDLALKLNPTQESFYEGQDWSNLSEVSTVISCMPYHQNFELAKYCIDNNKNYTDLGGSVEVSNQIKEYIKDKKYSKTVFTDLGLAPGLVNIYLEHLLKHNTPTTVRMYVGGLPQLLDWRQSDYSITWSIDGLYNEYIARCQVLVDGINLSAEALSGYETFKGIGNSFETIEFEAFTTSGGSAHTIPSLQKRGIKNCIYKTVRYKGHFDRISVLLNSGLSETEIKRAFTNLFPETRQDLIVLKVITENQKEGLLKTEFSKVIYNDPTFSAMQRSTGFSAASVVDLIEDNMVESGYASYEYVPISQFFTNLNTLGL